MPHKDPVAAAEYQKVYRQKHAEKLRVYSTVYRAENFDYLRQQKQQDYERNKEAYKRRSKTSWHAKLYWEQKFHHGIVKARATGAEIVDTDSIREYYREVFSREAEICTYCRSEFPILKITVDHKQPYALGGRHEISNFVVSCISCNVKKHTTPFEVWTAKHN